ncbi:MAG TPA: head GIN domain-containing protein [Sphingomicrobium sp.]|jgi:hypothetical protein|nr:head GIN domain-containing protein [Sphingomicrobium sp.]
MRKFIATAAIVAASASTGACGRMHQENAGPTVSRNYQVGNFHEIEVAGPYDVNVRTGSNVAVSAEGPQKILDHAVVEVEGDKLVIRSENHVSLFSWGFGSHGKTVFTVTVPQLRAATMAGSGDLNIDKVQGDQFEGKMAGSGDLGVGSLNVQSLKLAMAGAGDTKIGSGQAQNAEYKIVGSGDIDAPGVNTQQLTVSIAGSGNIRAHATGAAEVTIMGSGDVEVSGGAKCTVTKHGSGDVRCS